MSGGRHVCQDRHAEIGADGKSVRHRDDLLAGIFRGGDHRIGSVGEDNVDAAFRHMPAIDIPVGRRRRAVCRTGQEFRLRSELPRRPDEQFRRA